ncbi:hypothetical protein R5R35_005226 [Gryllus longicercus]|uniref:CHK kinase-like domain-containing protein n=1 Tax=Gryllus longicercus TaxID=2509291 RepID=A0AAN9VGB1_9ORTH
MSDADAPPTAPPQSAVESATAAAAGDAAAQEGGVIPIPSSPRPAVPPTEDFLLHALRASGEEGAMARLAALEVEPAGGAGDNFLGELWRARVTLEDAAGARRTRCLVVKRQPTGDEREVYLREARLFDVEAAAYTSALPAMLRLLRGAYGETFRPFWPHFVYASLDRTELVMEDMSTLDFQLADRKVGLDLDQSKAVVKHMALLHAASMAMYSQNQPAVFPFLESLFRDSTRQFLETYLRAGVRQLALQLREWPEWERYAEKVSALEDKCWDMITAAVARDDVSFNVLNHGDLWVNNVLFRKGDGPSSLDLEVALIDWQNAVWTSPALDLLYFLYTSPADEVRREHGDALLQLYHGTLQQAAQALGVGARAPSLETLRADLRRRFAIAVFPAFAELPNMLAPKDLHYDIAQYFQEEPPRNKAYGAEPYASIIRRLLPLFEDCGVI